MQANERDEKCNIKLREVIKGVSSQRLGLPDVL